MSTPYFLYNVNFLYKIYKEMYEVKRREKYFLKLEVLFK